MKAYKKIMSGVAELEKIVLSVILVFVTLITFANVVVRKLSDSQFAWTEELVINLFVLLIMLGCGLCAREGSLISLSLIFDRLKVGGKKAFCRDHHGANTAFWLILLKTGIDKVASQMASREAHLLTELARVGIHHFPAHRRRVPGAAYDRILRGRHGE